MEIDKIKVLKILLNEQYYTLEDLRYNRQVGYLFSKDQLSEFLKVKNLFVKEKRPFIKNIPLKGVNSSDCYYVNGNYFLTVYNEYLRTVVNDYYENKELFNNRNMEGMVLSRVYSEIEGTLRIENVQTTHKRIKELFNSEVPKSDNDIIIKNMVKAIMFILNERPVFNKENLYKLYNMLSKDCLDEDEKLKEGRYYRDNAVFIGEFEGADFNRIDELMDGLFEFANDKKNLKEFDILLPQICHYYILYVHPYFDYNGRTARMVSFWLYIINEIAGAPLFMSEAINENKSAYYKAIINTRVTGNDLTYFLGYILESAVQFSLVYKNVEKIKEKLSKEGTFLTQTELMYIKKIIIHNPTDYFNGKMFLGYINGEMSKQGYFKQLNNFVEYGVLTKSTNKKHEVIYRLNPDYLTYTRPE